LCFGCCFFKSDHQPGNLSSGGIPSTQPTSEW